MANRKIDNVKVGIFVAISIVMLILALYKVSKSSSLFSENFILKAQFKNVSGLMVGNNIRYMGIQVGTIEGINIFNDSLVEVTMQIDEKMKSFIHQKDYVGIGTDGLVGNKLMNITQGKERSPVVVGGDILGVKETANADEMMGILNNTNRNIAVISEELKTTVLRLNNSSAMWHILNEKTIPENMIASMVNVRNATVRADDMVAELQTVIKNVKNGKGSLGAIITDTTLAISLTDAVAKIKAVGENANVLTNELNNIAQNVKLDLTTSKGAYNALLKDTLLTVKLNSSLYNIEAGTVSFNQNMEALKHNFLFRRYFKKMEKKKKMMQAQKGKITVEDK